MNLNRTPDPLDRNARLGENKNWDEIEGKTKSIDNRIDQIVDEVSDVAFDKVVDSARLDWDRLVDKYSELPSNPKKGTTIGVKENGLVYRYDGTKWVDIYEINLNPIAEVDERLTSQLNDIVTVNHLLINVGNVTSALQSLINRADDGTVFEFKGTYEIDSVFVNQKNIKFIARDAVFLVNDTNHKGIRLQDADGMVIDGIKFKINFEGLPQTGSYNHDFFIYGTGKNVKIYNCDANGLGLARLNYADGCIIQNNKLDSGTTSQEIFDSGHERLLRGIELDNTAIFRIIGNDVYNYGQDGIKTQVADRDGVNSRDTEVGYILYNYINGITLQDAIDTYNNGSRLIIHGNTAENCQKMINVKKEEVNNDLNSFDNIISANIFKGGEWSASVYGYQMGIQCKSDNCIITNNIIYDVEGQGIHVRECENVQVSTNNIHDIFKGSGTNIDTGVGIEVAGNVKNISLSENNVIRCDYISISIKTGDFQISGGVLNNFGYRGLHIQPGNNHKGATITGLKINDDVGADKMGIFIGSTNKSPIMINGCYIDELIETPFTDSSHKSVQSGNNWNTKATYGPLNEPNGTYKRGDIHYNNEPWQGGFVGAICTLSGTTGSLIGIIGSISSGSNILTVNDASRLSKGQYLAINGISHTVIISHIDENTVFLRGKVSTSVINSEVRYSAPVFKNFGAIST